MSIHLPDHSDAFDLATTLDETGDARISITGDLDWDTADELTETARVCLGTVPPPRHLRIDCARLTLCDSLGLAALLMTHRNASAAGTRLHLDNRPASLDRLLEITGTDHLFAEAAPASGRPGHEQDRAGSARPPLPPSPS
ncbi:STAS domain-containing protein [Streptomyces sp. NPDC015131]|uniref:STAS domain-containing protein n=1 Tax=Streptomyces sp. NPDC015131 TaxID=3364941 RepID=UPI0036FE8FA3